MEFPRARLLDIARSLGFFAAGAAAAVPGDEMGRLRRFVADGRHGTMRSLAQEPGRRGDPRRVLPGARSVVMVAAACPAPADPGPAPQHGRLARYTCHDDYHDVLIGPLRELAGALGDPEARAFVDSSPLMEKAWAQRAGLGWVGRNTLLITRQRGVWQLLGSIVTRTAVEPSAPSPDLCGRCTRCIDACPTAALELAYDGAGGGEGGRPTGGVLDARRCRSYLNIEHRGSLEPHECELLGDALLGCDLCLDACPWNRFATGDPFPGFTQRLPLRMELTALLALDGPTFRARFEGTPVSRVRRRRLLRNALIILGNQGEKDALDAIERCAAGDPDQVVREHAVWAAARISRRA